MPRDTIDFVEAPLRHAVEIATVARMEELLAESEDWCQGVTYPGTGPHCLMGALAEVSPPSHEYILVLASMMHEAGVGGVVEFNDTHTHAEVLGLLARVRRQFEEAE